MLRTRPFFSALLLGACCVEIASASPAVVAPDGCGSAAEFEREVKERLTQASEVPPTRVWIVAQPGGYRLTIQTAAEIRELFNRDCRELFRAAIVIAVARASEHRQATPLPPPGLAPSRSTESRGESGTQLRLGLSAGGGLHLGLAPHPSVAPEVEGQILFGRLGLGLAIRHLINAGDQDDQGLGVSVSGPAAMLRVLYALAPAWRAGLGFGVVRLKGVGLGSADNAEDTAWSAGPTISAGWIPLRVRHFWLGVGVETQLNLLRARYEILNHGEVFRVSPVSAGLTVGVGWEFF